jgi:glutathione S-transferase
MSAAHPALAAGRLTLSGVPGSPYTRKMLALLRYRRIPYRLLLRSHDPGDLPKPRVPMLPTFYLPNAHGEVEAVTDSTPLIRRFESEFEGREAIPADPALALIDALIEDYGDEWLTKAMFHYRWAYDDDIHRASRILPTWSRGPFTDAAHRQAGADISTRQIPRLSYVGSSHITGPVIEESYGRFLDIFEDHLRTHHFWLGRRPGSGDFAVYGQLTQLALFDPTPMALTLEHAPRVFGWVGAVDDLSGLDPAAADWFAPDALPGTTRALLAEIGRVYAPLLLANAAAVAAGAGEVETQIDGRPWRQRTFPYQSKCLAWLRRDYEALTQGSRERFDSAIAGSGCEPLFA